MIRRTTASSSVDHFVLWLPCLWSRDLAPEPLASDPVAFADGMVVEDEEKPITGGAEGRGGRMRLDGWRRAAQKGSPIPQKDRKYNPNKDQARSCWRGEAKREQRAWLTRGRRKGEKSSLRCLCQAAGKRQLRLSVVYGHCSNFTRHRNLDRTAVTTYTRAAV